MKNWLRAALIEFLGIEKLRDRVIDLDNELGEVEHFVKFPTDKIRARKITASTIRADKLDTRNPVPPVVGCTYKTRNGQVVGPMKYQGFGEWTAPNYMGTWMEMGRRAGVPAHSYDDLDLVEGVDMTPLEAAIREAGKIEELTPVDNYKADLLSSLHRMSEMSRRNRHLTDYNKGYHDAYEHMINMVRGK